MPHPTPAATPEKQAAFLDALAETCSVKRACWASDVSRTTAYRWRGSDPDFAARWDEARMRSADLLHDEAVRRAIEGIEEPVYHAGKCIDTVRKYSDALLMFLLKGAKPEVYKDRVVTELSGPGGAPIAVEDVPAAIAEILQSARGRLDAELAAARH